MKIKKLYQYFLVAATSIATFSACNSILNPEVIDIPTSTNALQAPADIEKALAGGYNLIRTVVPDKIFLMGDVRANQFSSYSQTVNVRVETPIPDNTLNGLLGNGGGDWSGFYRAISQCNLVIENIPMINSYTENVKQQHIGEAHFMRALAYFYLIRFWGDVPIVLKSVDLDNIPRSKQEEVIKLINSDLNIAIANLPFGTVPTRATKGAAWAIKAHVAAWTQDYVSAEKLCDSVIRFGGYKLITDTTKLVSMFVGKSSEGIFELNFDANMKEVQKCRVFNRTLGRPWYRDVSDGGGGSERYMLTPTREQLDEMFPIGAKDARKFAWFIKEKYKEDRPYFGKYRTLQLQGDTSSQNINESNIIITRLADVMLLRAEALASTAVGKEAAAVTVLNEVRGRAGARLYQGGGSLRDTILLERRKELIGEGHFFFDLVRTRKLDVYSKIKNADWYTKGAWLLPINQSIITNSSNVITQNSFWQ